MSLDMTAIADRVLLKKEMTFGITAHSLGMGVNYQDRFK